MTPGEFDDAIACYHIINGAREKNVPEEMDDWNESIP